MESIALSVLLILPCNRLQETIPNIDRHRSKQLLYTSANLTVPFELGKLAVYYQRTKKVAIFNLQGSA